jgi:uncharacterized protein
MTTKLKLTKSDKKQLLSIARDVIKYCFETDCAQDFRYGKNKAYYDCEENLLVKYSDLKIPILQETLSCFVTLFLIEGDSRKLRGCIGTLEARSNESLLENLICNSMLAAFGDNRFEPLGESELSSTQLEISILSKPEPVDFETADELFSKIEGKGVILTSEFHKATFLPQVWQQIKDPGTFLIHLARKAGMSSGAYLSASYEIYEVLAFEEENGTG